MPLRLSILAPSPEQLAAISRNLPNPEASNTVSSLLGGVRELVAEIERSRPDVVVAEVAGLSDDELGQLSGALLAAPSTSLVLLSADRSPEYLLKLMRSGVRELVFTPLAGDDLRLAYRRQAERSEAARNVAAPPRGRLIAFVPAKGGSGATFLSTNLAYALAQRGRRTAVLDLNLHFGDASIFVSEARPTQTVADLAREVARVDGTFLEATMLSVAPNMWLLAAPDSPEAAIDVSPEAIERILAVARSRYDFVVVDMGRILEAVSVRALDQADEIYIVVQPTLPFIHDAKRLIGMLAKLGYPRERFRLVINRYEKGGDVTVADIEESLGMRASVSVPNNFSVVAYSINHGVPILKYAPRDAVSRALVELADALAPPQGRRGGWFRALGGRRD